MRTAGHSGFLIAFLCKYMYLHVYMHAYMCVGWEMCMFVCVPEREREREREREKDSFITLQLSFHYVMLHTGCKTNLQTTYIYIYQCRYVHRCEYVIYVYNTVVLRLRYNTWLASVCMVFVVVFGYYAIANGLLDQINL